MNPARAALLASAAFMCMALTEPQPIPGGDVRYRTVEWRDGIVIQAFGSRGKTILFELPRGVDAVDILPSDQDVITGKVAEASGVTGRGAANQPDAPEGCIETANMQICIKNDRFIGIKPKTELQAQPIPVMMVSGVNGANPVERQFVIEISTTDTPYYVVRVTVPQPVPVQPRQPVVRRWPTQPRPPVAAPPVELPPVNNAYSITGDRALLGVQGR
jgi:hypothetical protein